MQIKKGLITKRIYLITIFLFIAPMTGCNRNRSCIGQKNLTTMQGILIKKGATKSYESIVAGESEYYVIGNIILRPSKQVSSNDFEKYKGKKVTVKGYSVKSKPYTPPEDSVGQWPMNPDGTPMTIPVGAGFKVCEISIAQDDEAGRKNPE